VGARSGFGRVMISIFNPELPEQDFGALFGAVGGGILGAFAASQTARSWTIRRESRSRPICVGEIHPRAQEGVAKVLRSPPGVSRPITAALASPSRFVGISRRRTLWLAAPEQADDAEDRDPVNSKRASG